MGRRLHNISINLLLNNLNVCILTPLHASIQRAPWVVGGSGAKPRDRRVPIIKAFYGILPIEKSLQSGKGNRLDLMGY